MAKKENPSLTAILIPICCIATILLYFHQTAEYRRFESVKFPYVMGAAALVLFGAILIKEVRSYLKARRERDGKERASVNPRRLYPLWVVLITLAYVAAIGKIFFLGATYIYILALKALLSRLGPKQALYDLFFLAAIYLAAHEVLFIPLPSGPVEELLISAAHAVMPG